MTTIKAYMANHQDIAKTLYRTLEPILIATVCLGTAPFLIWIASNQYGIGWRTSRGDYSPLNFFKINEKKPLLLLKTVL